MTGTAWKLAPIIAGLLLVLTYLLIQGTSPNPARHERTLHALRALILTDAALQRDALKARAGLLPSYDPLVRAADDLHLAVATLRTFGDASAEIGQRFNEVATAVAEQEALVEILKSDNALLQNSLTYFTHASSELGARGGDGAGQTVAAEVGRLATSMRSFLHEPQSAAAGEVAAALDRVARLPVPPSLDEDIRTLVAHGRLVVDTLPEVDDVLSRLLAAPTTKLAQALLDAYLDHHGRIEARARVFRVLLYLASVALLAYLTLLFLRLRVNAQALAERSSALQARLGLESLITGISADFISLPPDRVDDCIDHALAKLGEHLAVDRAYILRSSADGRRLESTHAWCRAGVRTSGDRLEDLPVIGPQGGLEKFEWRGCLHVPCVDALSATPASAALEERGVRSWLCLPMGRAGTAVGFLGFDAVHGEKRWSDDDIALLRTAGEILASALERRRAEAERSALEARLRRSRRLEAIGTLAGGIAHDFNNILGAILGHCEMALAALPADGRPRHHVRQVMAAGERAQGVVDQVLAFSRRGEQERRPVRVRPLVEEAVGLLRASLPATVVIRLRLAAGDATVLGDPTRLHQVVMNLCTNAAQAMRGRGTLEVALDSVEFAGARAMSHGSLTAGPYVRLAVSDSGQGMDAATLERIFDPFFTTKAAGGGTGLGLATVHGIVADHGGALDVRSRPGEGSTFEAYFARAEGPAAGADDDEGAAAPVPGGRGETILLVDDEQSLVALGEEMLAALGYEPVGFASSPRALAAFRADPRRFDLVLTDEVMPEMTGTELAVALHRLRPELPVILMTGHGGPLRWPGLQAAGVREVLRKPLRSRDLAASIARHLRPSAGADPPSSSAAAAGEGGTADLLPRVDPLGE